MPRKIDPATRRAIERAALKQKSLGAVVLRRKVVAAIERGRLSGPAPATRTIGEIIREVREKPGAERLTIEAVTWPESFGDDELQPLPWAASAAYFDLSGELDGLRPLYPVMVWYWRLSQAMPDASAANLRWLAVDLAFWERMPAKATERDRRTMEAYILRRSAAGDYVPAVPQTLEQYSAFDQQQRAEITELKYGALSLDSAELGPVHMWLRERQEREEADK